MAPIKLKEIGKVSSEDKNFPASNLLVGQKWMNNAEDNNTEAFIEVVLDVPSRIHYVDIGYFNVASLEVQVSSSSRVDPLNILDNVLLQNSADARAGRNKSGCRMFNFHEHLKQEVAKSPWDRVKIILHQPHARKKHMGLEFLRLGTPRNVTLKKTPSTYCKQPANSYLPSIDELKSSPSSASSQFEAKLRNMSAPSESSGNSFLGRTAKMLMSSKRASQQNNQAESKTQSSKTCQPFTSSILHDDEVPVLQKSTRKRKSLVKGERLHVAPGVSEPSSIKDGNTATAKSLCLVDVVVHLPPAAENNIESANNQAKTKSKAVMTGEKAKNPTQTVTYSLNTPIVEINEEITHADDLKGKHEYRLEDGSENSFSLATSTKSPRSQVSSCPTPVATGISATSQEQDVVEFVKETKEVVYTDKQIRQLKKAIKNFFNTLDVDSIDFDTMKVKDLRKRFESSHDVKLNKDGRSYFRELTGKFMSLVSTRRQQNLQSQHSTAGTKRKPEMKENPSIAKVSKQSASGQASSLSHAIAESMVECPICFEYFESSVVGNHAALCGQENDNDLPAFNITSSHFSSSNESIATGIAVDTSRNSCLTSAEQQHWINFSKQPKPYQERLNRDDYEGCMLVKCPTCGQKYKESEIEIHGDDCAEKVNSGCTRMGLYLLEPKQNHRKETSSSGDVPVTHSPYLFD